MDMISLNEQDTTRFFEVLTKKGATAEEADGETAEKTFFERIKGFENEREMAEFLDRIFKNGLITRCRPEHCSHCDSEFAHFLCVEEQCVSDGRCIAATENWLKSRATV